MVVVVVVAGVLVGVVIASINGNGTSASTLYVCCSGGASSECIAQPQDSFLARSETAVCPTKRAPEHDLRDDFAPDERHHKRGLPPK